MCVCVGWERGVIANLGSSINSPSLATSSAPAAVDQPDCALLAGLLCWAAMAESKQPHGAFFGRLFFLVAPIDQLTFFSYSECVNPELQVQPRK